MFPNYDIQMKPYYQIEEIEKGRIRVVVKLLEDVELGVLYFEKAKTSFQRKPLSMDAWRCVDAKVEGLYERDKSLTPKDIVQECQRLIKEGGY